MLSKKQEKWLKEGRGQGEMIDYKPWLKVSDISSSGRSHRVFGHKTRRTHHFLMSDLELATFLFLEWNPEVIDIREQFLLNYNDTVMIAEDILRHRFIFQARKLSYIKLNRDGDS